MWFHLCHLNLLCLGEKNYPKKQTLRDTSGTIPPLLGALPNLEGTQVI